MKYLSQLIESKKHTINYDMTKSFRENHNVLARVEMDHYDTPIDPSESSWEEITHRNETFLKKTYIFKNTQQIKYFIDEFLNKANKVNYFPELFLKENQIKVFLKNEFVNQIMDEDILFSKFLDEIYEDIHYIHR